MAAVPQVFLDIARYNSNTFLNASSNDALIRTNLDTQKILIGTLSNNLPSITVSSNNVFLVNKVAIGDNTSLSPSVAFEVQTTDSLLLPKGTTGQRPSNPQQGYVRYNTSINTFEGYGAGNAWGSLGGVKDTNQDTYISAESFPTSNDDNLVFFNSNIERMRLTTEGRLGIGTSNPAYLLHVGGQGYFQEDLMINSNLAVGRSILMQGLRITKNTGTSANFTPVSIPGLCNDAFGNMQLYNQNDQANTGIIFATGISNEIARFTGDGRLGIGKSNPDYELDVNGNIGLTSNLIFTTPLASAASNNLILSKAGELSISSETALNFIMDNNSNHYGNFTTAIKFGYGSSNSIQNFTEYMRIATNGNVGIGNLAPASKLHVTTNAANTIVPLLTLQNSGGGNLTAGACIDFYTYNTPYTQARINCLDQNFSGHIVFSTKEPGNDANALVERVRLTNGGNFGIGTSNPGYKLEVSGAIYASGDITALSDIRYKDNIVPLDEALSKVSMIKGYYYNRKDDLNKRCMGFIAQELTDVVPELVSYDKVNDKYGVNYGNMTALLLEAVKELQEQISMKEKTFRYTITTIDNHAILPLPVELKSVKNVRVWISATMVMGYGRATVNHETGNVDIEVSEDGDYNVLIIGE